jgi:transcription antitermination factor NusG
MPYLVVVSDLGRERECRQSVRDSGFTCYMPLVRDQVVRQGRKVWQERPMLGRYFFARHAPGCDWRSLTNLRLVKGLFMRVDCEEPALVRDLEIEIIRAGEDQSGFVTNAARRQFTRGQKVRAAVGVMAGNEGEYVGTGRGDCDVALLNLFGRATRIEFAPGVLRAA